MISLQDDLALAAEEELGHAAAIGWRELSRCMPWGDTFEGFSPGGRPVCLERAYLWAGDEGGDIVCEVTAYEERRYEEGVKRTRLIAR